MREYTYTIFDADPAQSGPCWWPGAVGVRIEASTADDAAELALELALEQARACPDYTTGDRLWCVIWDEAGESWTRSAEIESA